MECGDSSPLFGEGFSLHNLGVNRVSPRPRKHARGRCTSRIAPTDMPFGPDERIFGAIHESPLPRMDGPACRVRGTL